METYSKKEIPLNTEELLETLMEVHAYQIFQNGVFNADPHPV